MKYQIKFNNKEVYSDDLINNLKNVCRKDDYIICESNDIFDDGNIVIYNKKNNYILLFKKHLIGIISLIIIALFFLNLNLSFIKIKYDFYNLNEEQKDEIINELSTYYDEVFIFKYLKININEINLKLKNKYYDYEWINVYKDGVILNVCVRAKENNGDQLERIIPGNIYANHDGIIYKTFVKCGKLLVQNNFFVRSGDLLVSGNLLYDSLSDNNNLAYLKADAVILACIFDFKECCIKKSETTFIRSGNIEIFKSFSFVNKKIKCSFDAYETEIIKGKYFFNRDKIICYEIIENNNLYSYDDALSLSESIIISEFNKNKTHEEEEIIDLRLFTFYSDEEYYYFKFLVKSYKNIAFFKEINT